VDVGARLVRISAVCTVCNCVSLCTICRAKYTNHTYVYTVYVRCLWQGNHQRCGHIQCFILASPAHLSQEESIWHCSSAVHSRCARCLALLFAGTHTHTHTHTGSSREHVCNALLKDTLQLPPGSPAAVATGRSVALPQPTHEAAVKVGKDVVVQV